MIGGPLFIAVSAKQLTLIAKEAIDVSEQQSMPPVETRLGSELMAEVYKALNFEPRSEERRVGKECRL